MQKILVIDDDDIVNDMIVLLLKKSGYSVQGAKDGAVGLKMWQEQSFDLIITDIIMPEKEGIETILAIREKTNIPIIAISGGGRINSEDYLSLAEKLGADYSFSKPFDSKQFLATVKKCLEKK